MRLSPVFTFTLPLQLTSIMYSLILISSFSLVSTAFADVEIGAAAPDFTLKDQSGKAHTLSSYRGKTVVLEWTNPTCPFVEFHYKRDTMTKIAAANPDVIWLTIDSSYFATAAKNGAWASSEGVKTLLFDAAGDVGRLYGARTTPHMFVLDAQDI